MSAGKEFHNSVADGTNDFANRLVLLATELKFSMFLKL
jgi:hypothetical protein